MFVHDLMTELGNRGLRKGGVKEELIERLIEDDLKLAEPEPSPQKPTSRTDPTGAIRKAAIEKEFTVAIRASWEKREKEINFCNIRKEKANKLYEFEKNEIAKKRNEDMIALDNQLDLEKTKAKKIKQNLAQPEPLVS